MKKKVINGGKMHEAAAEKTKFGTKKMDETEITQKGDDSIDFILVHFEKILQESTCSFGFCKVTLFEGFYEQTPKHVTFKLCF